MGRNQNVETRIANSLCPWVYAIGTSRSANATPPATTTCACNVQMPATRARSVDGPYSLASHIAAARAMKQIDAHSGATSSRTTAAIVALTNATPAPNVYCLPTPSQATAV